MARLSRSRAVPARLFAWLGLISCLSPGVPAEDLTFSGRLDAMAAVLSPEFADTPGAGTLPDADQVTGPGMASGWVGLQTGGKEARAEMRLGFATWPETAADLTRAWVKFRLPGFRGTMGLGHIAWGPGFVFSAGDLLHDSTDLSVDFTSEDLRGGSEFLADLWWSLDDLSFLEVQVQSPAALSFSSMGTAVRVPSSLYDASAGLRLSLDSGSFLLEPALAWDGPDNLCKASLSAQFHALADWQLSLRWDQPADFTICADPLDHLGATAGGLLTADTGEWGTFSSRHEALWLPGNPWDLSGSPRPLGWTGEGLEGPLYSFHDLAWSPDRSWSFTLRGMASWADLSGLLMLQADFRGLQSLDLWLAGSVLLGQGSDTFATGRQGWLALRGGARFTF